MNYSPFIYAFEQRNIAITGQERSTGKLVLRPGGRGMAERNTVGKKVSPISESLARCWWK